MSRRLALALLLLVAAGAGWAEGVTWGWLGVRIRDLTELEMEEISSHHGIQEGFGALIVEVLPETPAARDGLRNGDLIVAFRDRPVVDTRSLQRLVATTPAGEEVILTVLRGEEGRRGLTVRVGVMPREVIAERIAAEFGFLVREPLGERGDRSARPSTAPTVSFVLERSAADRAGLKSGDFIVEVNGRPVLSRQAVSEALAEAILDQPLRLAVKRGEERIRLTVNPARPRIH
jgi:S1-C subfamily serine protease